MRKLIARVVPAAMPGLGVPGRHNTEGSGVHGNSARPRRPGARGTRIYGSERELVNNPTALMRGMRKRGLTVLCAMGVLGTAMPALATDTITQFSYDAGDHVTRVTDPRNLVTTYIYDGLDQRWQQTSPDTGTTTWNYSYGRPVSMTRADGVSTTYGYDALSRVTSVSAGGQTQTFTYDTCTNGVGRLCSAADATGTTSYSYSPEGWVTGRGFSISGTTYALGYGYNALGQVASVVYPDGNQAIYSYTRGVVSEVTLNVSGTNVTGASAITYQPMNAGMSSWTSSNGIVNTLGYDTDGRLTSISADGVQSLSFSYDDADRIVGITNGIDSTMSQNFGYDEESRLRSVYSDADNQSFQYDADGNRLTQTRNGANTTYTINPNSNQLTGLSGATTASYGYTPQGNATTVDGSTAYMYNPFNRLSSAGSVTNYVNPEGQRLGKSGGSTGTTYFAPDSGSGLMAEDDNGIWIDYVWLNGRLIGRVAGGQVYAIHADQVGRPEAVSDASRVLVWRARNFAFDRTVVQNSISGLNLGFPGQYYDAETSTWNNGYRDFSAALGRYIESDPVGLAAGPNTYAYVANNPIIFFDPNGLCWVYSQSAHTLTHIDASGTADYATSSTYSGLGAGLNNPAMQNVAWKKSGDQAGPIPQGFYSIGRPRNSLNTGRFIMDLTPTAGTNTFGRSAFEMHGDNSAMNHTASHGCIVAPPAIRKQVASSGDNCLQVTQ